MKKILFIGLSFLFLSSITLAQNRIQNFSFENGGSSGSQAISNGNCDNWEGAGATSGIGSADWFKFPENDGLFGVNGITGATGIAYVGMLPYEMVQTSFQLEVNVVRRHTLKFKIRIPQHTNYSGFPFNWTASDSPVLDIYLSKDKIRYDNTPLCTQNRPPVFSGNPILMRSIPITLNEYPPGSWHQLEIEIMMPDFGIEWIGFELTTNNCIYLLMDDVELEEIPCEQCNLTCDPVDGCIESVFLSTSHNSSTPFSVAGLNNVSYFNLSLSGVPGGNPFRVIDIDNPTPIISWDGKNSVGLELAAGFYFYTVILGNNCELHKFTGTIAKNNSQGDPTEATEYTMDYTSLLEKQDFNDQCCYECINITKPNIDYIDPPGTVLEAGGVNTLIGTFEIVAIDKIVVDENIFFTIGSNITLKAGQSIDFDKEMNIFEGAEVECIIDECMPEFQGGGNVPVVSRISNNNLGLIKRKEVAFSISPNPSTGIIQFNLPESEYESRLTLISVGGRIVHSVSIPKGITNHSLDLSNIGKGIYIVKYLSKNNITSKKLVLK